MEESWLIKRQQLRELLREPRLRSYRELADETSASLAWGKRWVARLRTDLANDALLHRRASPSGSSQPSRSSEVVEKILDMRDHPPANLRRVPGPKTILYFLAHDEQLARSHVPVPKSTEPSGRY